MVTWCVSKLGDLRSWGGSNGRGGVWKTWSVDAGRGLLVVVVVDAVVWKVLGRNWVLMRMARSWDVVGG